MGEIKAVSFRLGDGDIQRFREFAEEQGMNQAEMFQSLINNFEMAKAKGAIIDRAKEIETFQDTVNTLVGMFVNSLAVNQTSEERIREMLSIELNSKDKTIADLQAREKHLKAQSDDAHKELNKCTDQLHSLLVRADKLEKEIEQKNGVIKTQQEQINTLNSIVAEYKPCKDENVSLKNRCAELTDKLNEAAHVVSDLQSKLKDTESMRDFYKTESETTKGELRETVKENKELVKSNKTEIDELRVAHAADVERLKQDLAAKFEKDLKNRIELETGKLQTEISKLQLELERAADREKGMQKENNSLNETINLLLSQDKKEKE